MQKRAALVQQVCAPYCVYYKPGKNEELLCRGAVVAERLMDAGRDIAVRGGVSVASGQGSAQLLMDRVCSVCAFREHDCDFAEDHSRPPCGGFLLLTKLLDLRTLRSDDLLRP